MARRSPPQGGRGRGDEPTLFEAAARHNPELKAAVPLAERVRPSTLADMVGTTRSRVNFFMKKFQRLGFIDYTDGLRAFLFELNGAVGDWTAAWRYAADRRVESTLFSGQEARPGTHFTLLLHGIEAMMLTGDTERGARAVADPLGMPYLAGLSPEDKVRRMDALGESAAMVGDGLNDALALAGSGPSFAVDGGTDLARGMAQVGCPGLGRSCHVDGLRHRPP